MAQTIGSLDLNAFSDLYSDSTQYFWFESNASATYGAGAHVTLVPDTSFISNPTGQNILMNTDGFSIRNGLLPMMTLDNNSLDFNVVDTTAGTYVPTATFSATGAQIGQSSGTHLELNTGGLSILNGALPMMTLNNGSLDFNVVDTTEGTYTTTATFTATGAQIGQSSGAHIQIISSGLDVNLDASTNIATFGSSGARIGKTTAAHSVIDADGQRFYASDGTTQLANIGYGEGQSASGTNIAPYYTFGIRQNNTTKGNYSVAEGYYTTASGYCSHAEGGITTASGSNSHAEGRLTTAGGHYSHAEGSRTTAGGHYSHAGGRLTTASGDVSHAEGYSSTTNGYGAHVEGYATRASGNVSHVMGMFNKEDPSYYALTTDSYVHSNKTYYTYNYDAYTPVSNPTDDQISTYYEHLDYEAGEMINGGYAFIIGNGTSTRTRSNALTVDWNGNLEAAGSITSAITACGNTTSLSLTQSEKIIPITTYRYVVGSQLSVSSNGVLCGKDGFVEVSACVYFMAGFTVNDLVHVVIKNGSTNIVNAAHRMPQNYEQYSVSPLVWEVSAGDIIYLYAYNQLGSRGNIANDVSTMLTVKYL